MAAETGMIAMTGDTVIGHGGVRLLHGLHLVLPRAFLRIPNHPLRTDGEVIAWSSILSQVQTYPNDLVAAINAR
jgi:hypothetical protein